MRWLPEPIAALYRAVAERPRAAFDDSRSRVTKEEASQLEVSLSVLSRLFPIHPDAVEVGRHGLVISRESHRGLLLPQVPVEFAWAGDVSGANLPQSGLPVDCWRRDATSRRSPPSLLRRRSKCRLILYHEFHSRLVTSTPVRVSPLPYRCLPAKRRNLSAGALVVKRRYEVSVTRSTWNSQL